MFQNQKNLLNPFSSMACFVQMKIYVATFYIKEIKVSELKDRSVEIILYGQEREKRLKQ